MGKNDWLEVALNLARAVVPPPRLRAFPLAFDADDASGLVLRRWRLARDLPGDARDAD